MKRFDYLTPVGFMLGCIIVAIGILSGTGLAGISSFLDLTSFLIVTGGLLCGDLYQFSAEGFKENPFCSETGILPSG